MSTLLLEKRYHLQMLKIRHTLVRVQNIVVIRLVTFGFLTREQNSTLIRLGSDYGGWWLPKVILRDKSKKRILISAGLGFDVTFDEALLDAGFEVLGLDPLEDSVNYAAHKLQRHSKFTGIAMGLWKDTGMQAFFPPKNESHDSWSATNIQSSPSTAFMDFRVISLTDLFCKFPQLDSSDYCGIKMDIEGSEIELIPYIADFKKKFDLLAIEMDFLSLIPFLSLWTRICMVLRARKLLQRLNERNYKLVMRENFNFIWI